MKMSTAESMPGREVLRAARAAGNGGDDDHVDLLEEVTLLSFTATPAAIGAFGASVLNWNVAGVKPGVKVLLDNSEVPAVSQRVVQPPTTRAYHLAAVAGPGRKALGLVQVQVNLSSCTDHELLGAFNVMRAFLFNSINNGPGTYWSGAGPDRLSVTEVDGQIHFRMVFRKQLRETRNSLIDLWISLQGTFGLAIEDGRFVPVGVVARGSAEFPTWLGFLLGFLGGLALAVNEADKKANDQARAFVDRLVEVLNLLLVPPPGKRARTVQVGQRVGQPIITYVLCADAELQILAKTLAERPQIS